MRTTFYRLCRTHTPWRVCLEGVHLKPSIPPCSAVLLSPIISSRPRGPGRLCCSPSHTFSSNPYRPPCGTRIYRSTTVEVYQRSENLSSSPNSNVRRHWEMFLSLVFLRYQFCFPYN